MSEFKSTAKDAFEAEKIRRQYIKKEDNKIEKLRRLDSKVKLPGRITAVILGIAGALLLGSGMSLVMVFKAMTMGLVLGIPGLIILLLIYPVYTLIIKRRKVKYSQEIIELSSEIADNKV